MPDRHGTLPLSMLCRKYGLSEAQLALLIKSHPPAARTANRFGKLPLHFLVRNPRVTRTVVDLFAGANSMNMNELRILRAAAQYVAECQVRGARNVEVVFWK